MEPEKGGIENSKSVRDMHHLRLMSLLQEQVRDHGRRRAAEILGVDRRTLDTALDQGMLTRRIRGALEKALQSGWVPPPPGSGTATTGWRIGWGTWRAWWRSRARRCALAAGRRGRHRELREEQAQGLRKVERAVAGMNKEGGSEGEEKPSGSQLPKTITLRREYPRTGDPGSRR